MITQSDLNYRQLTTALWATGDPPSFPPSYSWIRQRLMVKNNEVWIAEEPRKWKQELEQWRILDQIKNDFKLMLAAREETNDRLL